jgi:alpha-L-fucosidase
MPRPSVLSFLCFFAALLPGSLSTAALCSLGSGGGSRVVLLGNVTARPSAAQLAWMAKEVGVMVTFNLQSLCVGAGAANASSQACQVSNLYVPTLAAVHGWSPPALDADAWLAAAASFGARYAVLTAAHMTGFALWPTRAHNVSMAAATSWRGGGGDVVADFFAAAARANISAGVFYSTHFNWVLGVNEYRVGWPRLYGGAPLTQAAYEELVLLQLRELAAYAPFELWFDGGVNLSATPRVAAAVRALFPDAICHSCAGFSEAAPGGPGAGRAVRWMGNEEGAMPLPSWAAADAASIAPPGSPVGGVFAPPSCDTVLTEHQWFFEQGEDAHLRSTCALTNVYLTSVGRAANLILNMAPGPSGAILPAEAAAYAALGAAVACLWAAPLGAWAGLTLDAATGAAAVPAAAVCPPAGCTLTAVLQEELAAGGQRIAAWTLEACLVDAAGAGAGGGGDAACAAGVWADALPAATPAAAATGVGHKRILALRTPPGKSVAALRFTARSAYAWAGGGGDPNPPLVLARLELFDRANASACVPGCSLVDY